MIINGFGGMESGGLQTLNNAKLARNEDGDCIGTVSKDVYTGTVSLTSNITFTRWLRSGSSYYGYYSPATNFSFTVPDDMCYIPLAITAQRTSTDTGTWTLVSGSVYSADLKDSYVDLCIQCNNVVVPYYAYAAGNNYETNNIYPPENQKNISGYRLSFGGTPSQVTLWGNSPPTTSSNGWTSGVKWYAEPNKTYNFRAVIVWESSSISSNHSTTIVLKRSANVTFKVTLWRPWYWMNQ